MEHGKMNLFWTWKVYFLSELARLRNGDPLLEFCLFKFHTRFLSPLIGSCSSHPLPDSGVTYGSVIRIGPIFFKISFSDAVKSYLSKVFFFFFLDRQLLNDLLFVRVNLEA